MNPQPFQIEPFFLAQDGRRLFALHLYPDNPLRGALLYLHPFAEEMHKSRRMAALQARRFAAMGYAVLQVDLTGCGDSEKDFSEADWVHWQADAEAALAWLRQRWGGAVWLWGLRIGALLAADVSRRLELAPAGLLLWQPVLDGAQFLTQFLRIRLGSDLLASGRAQTGVAALRARLLAGEVVEVGGYGLAPAMAAGLDGLRLERLMPPCPVHWLECVADPARPVSPAVQRVVRTWQGQGNVLTITGVACASFWLTQEITECEALIEAGSALFEGPAQG